MAVLTPWIYQCKLVQLFKRNTKLFGNFIQQLLPSPRQVCYWRTLLERLGISLK